MPKQNFFLIEKTLHQQNQDLAQFKQFTQNELQLDKKIVDDLLESLIKTEQQVMKVIQNGIELLRSRSLLEGIVINELTDKDYQKIRSAFEEGESLAQVIGITDEQLVVIYEYASSLYNDNLLKDAETIFAFLVLLNSAIASFWYGWGSCICKNNSSTNRIIPFLMAFSFDGSQFKYFYCLVRELILADHEASAKNLLDLYQSKFSNLNQRQKLNDLF